MTLLITIAAVAAALLAVSIATGRMLRGTRERDEQRAEHTRRVIDELRRRRQ